MMLHTHNHYTLSCNVVTYLTALKSLQTFHNNVQMKLKSRKNVWSLCSNQKIRYKWLLECQIDYDQNFHCSSFHGNKNSSYITFTTVLLTLWRNWKSKNSLQVHWTIMRNSFSLFFIILFDLLVWRKPMPVCWRSYRRKSWSMLIYRRRSVTLTTNSTKPGYNIPRN